jgi:hypothetical protein
MCSLRVESRVDYGITERWMAVLGELSCVPVYKRVVSTFLVDNGNIAIVHRYKSVWFRHLFLSAFTTKPPKTRPLDHARPHHAYSLFLSFGTIPYVRRGYCVRRIGPSPSISIHPPTLFYLAHYHLVPNARLPVPLTGLIPLRASPHFRISLYVLYYRTHALPSVGPTVVPSVSLPTPAVTQVTHHLICHLSGNYNTRHK